MTLLLSTKLSSSAASVNVVELTNDQVKVTAQPLDREAALSKWGKHLLNDEQYEEALQWYEQSIVKNPHSSEAWYGRGEALANLGSYEDALTCLDRAISLEPDVSNYWTSRAVIMIHLSDYMAALNNCERALALEPDSREAWLFHGSALQRLGRYQEAYASFDRASGSKRQSLSQQVTGVVSRWFR